jgi:hypothetical protein
MVEYKFEDKKKMKMKMKMKMKEEEDYSLHEVIIELNEEHSLFVY